MKTKSSHLLDTVSDEISMELDVGTASGPANTERVLSSMNILNLTADKPGLGSDDGFVFSRNNNRAL